MPMNSKFHSINQIVSTLQRFFAFMRVKLRTIYEKIKSTVNVFSTSDIRTLATAADIIRCNELASIARARRTHQEKLRISAKVPSGKIITFILESNGSTIQKDSYKILPFKVLPYSTRMGDVDFVIDKVL